MRRVVVTGLGAVTPVGNDVPAFWENLLAGKNGIGHLDRFDTGEYKAKVAAQVKDFDPLRYMEKGEARKSDLFSQYAMAAACQAVEDSGIFGKVAPERFGVYFGSGIGGLITMSNEMQKLLEKGPKRVSPFFIPMMIANMAAGNIAIRFEAKGPCLPVTTACATSTNEVGEAFHAIRAGYADVILAGGAEATVTEISLAGFSSMKALSTRNDDPKAACCPFDLNRDGFVMGEGSGVLVMEELEHAKARGAHIIAEVVGYGSTNDAYHMTAPAPDGEGGARCMAAALKSAGIAPEDVDYINAHGTSTPYNDKYETAAIKTVFGDHAYKLAVSSTKSMTGHMLGAAGGVEGIITALAIEDEYLPATLHYTEKDPECDLDYVPNQGRSAKIEYAVSNSLGFGGHNASIVLKKYHESK